MGEKPSNIKFPNYPVSQVFLARAQVPNRRKQVPNPTPQVNAPQPQVIPIPPQVKPTKEAFRVGEKPSNIKFFK